MPLPTCVADSTSQRSIIILVAPTALSRRVSCLLSSNMQSTRRMSGKVPRYSPTSLSHHYSCLMYCSSGNSSSKPRPMSPSLATRNHPPMRMPPPRKKTMPPQPRPQRLPTIPPNPIPLPTSPILTNRPSLLLLHTARPARRNKNGQ